jgi:hypothetical protein
MVNNSYVSGSLILFNRHILFYIKSSSGFLLIERVALINIIITQGAKLFGPLKSLPRRDWIPTFVGMTEKSSFLFFVNLSKITA